VDYEHEADEASADDGPPSSSTKNLKPLFTDEVECLLILPVMTIQT